MLKFAIKWGWPILLGFFGSNYLSRKKGADIFGDQSGESTYTTQTPEDLFGAPVPSSFIDTVDKIISSMSPKSLVFILGLGTLLVQSKK